MKSVACNHTANIWQTLGPSPNCTAPGNDIGPGEPCLWPGQEDLLVHFLGFLRISWNDRDLSLGAGEF